VLTHQSNQLIKHLPVGHYLSGFGNVEVIC